MTDDRDRSDTRSPARRIETRLLILWFAVAFVVWNGVYDMRMHDTVRGYLLETTRAEAGLGRGVDMREYLRRGRVDAIAFSSAWSFGVFLAGLATMYTYNRTRPLAPRTTHRVPSTTHRAPSTEHRAPSTEHHAPSTEHRAPSTKHRALSTEH